MSAKSATQTKRRPAAAAKIMEAPSTPTGATAKGKNTKAKAAERSPSPEPAERPESFSTPTRAKKLVAAQVVTPKAKTLATPRAATDENAGDGYNKITPASLIKKGEFGKKGQKPSVPLDPRVQKVYKLINKSTGALGGNGYDGAIYGELTMHSMQKVLSANIPYLVVASNS